MRKALHAAAVILAALACSGAVAASSAPASPCPANGASDAGCPGYGPGAGPGMMRGGGGMMHGPHWGQGYTPGWTMMTPAERDEHRQTMSSFKTYEECRAYLDKFHTEMAARAQTRGMAMPATMPHDACAGLPKAPKKK